MALLVKLQIPKYLGPVRQGHFAFAESFATMFFSAIGLGVDRYIMKEVSIRPEHASDFVGGITALQTILAAVLFVAMGTTLWLTGRSAEIQLTVAVFGATQYLTYVNQTLASVLQATTRVGRLAAANVVTKMAWGLGSSSASTIGFRFTRSRSRCSAPKPFERRFWCQQRGTRPICVTAS